MEYRVTAKYNRPLIMHAARLVTDRSIGGRRGLVLLALSVLVFLFLLVRGERSWVIGLVGGTLLIAAVAIGSVYLTTYRRSLAIFERLPEKSIEFVFTDNAWGSTSGLGTQSASWKTIDSIVRDPRVWLLRMPGGSGYVMLPTEGIDDAARSFIVEQVRRNGGRVD